MLSCTKMRQPILRLIATNGKLKIERKGGEFVVGVIAVAWNSQQGREECEISIFTVSKRAVRPVDARAITFKSR